MFAPSAGDQALLGVMQNGLGLFAGHARKPFEEIIQPRPILQVLEERLDRHSRASENPRAADSPRRSFNCRTLTPIKHGARLHHATPTRKRSNFPKYDPEERHGNGSLGRY